jgi:hypothetical protein
MSNTPPPSGYLVPTGPGSGPRPRTVAISSLLLYLTSALLVVSAAVGVFAFSKLDPATIEDAYKQAGAEPAMAESAPTLMMAAAYGTAAVTVVIAILFVVLGLFIGKGKQWARITTWVVGGIGLCCCGLGLLSQGLASSLTTGKQGTLDQAKLAELLAQQEPSWSTTVNLVISVVQLLALVGVVTLLALPPSNAYFRRPAPEWTPPAYPTV